MVLPVLWVINVWLTIVLMLANILLIYFREQCIRAVPGPTLVTTLIMLVTIVVPGRVLDTLLRFESMKTPLWPLSLGRERTCVVPTIATAALRITFRGLTHTNEFVATRLHRDMLRVPNPL